MRLEGERMRIAPALMHEQNAKTYSREPHGGRAGGNVRGLVHGTGGPEQALERIRRRRWSSCEPADTRILYGRGSDG